MADFKNEGARLLWEIMKNRGLTQADVRAMLQGRSGPLADGAMSRWLHGDRRPSLSLASQLAELFGIPVQSWHQVPRTADAAPARSSRRAPMIVRRGGSAKRRQQPRARVGVPTKEAR